MGIASLLPQAYHFLARQTCLYSVHVASGLGFPCLVLLARFWAFARISGSPSTSLTWVHRSSLTLHMHTEPGAVSTKLSSVRNDCTCTHPCLGTSSIGPWTVCGKRESLVVGMSILSLMCTCYTYTHTFTKTQYYSPAPFRLATLEGCCLDAMYLHVWVHMVQHTDTFILHTFHTHIYTSRLYPSKASLWTLSTSVEWRSLGISPAAKCDYRIAGNSRRCKISRNHLWGH